MPYNKNEIKLSHNNYLKLRKNNGINSVKFGNDWYPVSTHVHTHSQMYLSPAPYDPGFSKADIDMNYFIGVPIHVIYNRRVFQSDFYNGRWNILNVWKW